MIGYAKALGSKGYKTAASATAITHDIDPRPGGRAVIVAFGATASESSDSIYFMKSLDDTTVGTTAASGGTTVVLTAALAPAGAAVAANDVVVFEMDNGTYHWSTVSSWTASTLTMVIGNAFDDDATAGNKVWCLGVSTDTGHDRYQLTASTQSTEQLEAGIFYGAAKNSPVRIHNANAGSTPGSIDYVTYAYVNK